MFNGITNVCKSHLHIYNSALIHGKPLWGKMKCKFINSTHFSIKAVFVVNHVCIHDDVKMKLCVIISK